MTAKDLIEYLSDFPLESPISFIVANRDKDERSIYPIRNMFAIRKDEENDSPCLCLDIGKAENLDEVTT